MGCGGCSRLNHTEKLQALLRTLFQLDLADLDFGLYRLFHLRRTEIEEFISEQLPREVDEAFAAVSAEEEQRLEEELEDIKAQIKEQISEEAFLPTGELKPEYQQSDIKMVQELSEKYEQVRKKIEETQITEGHKAEVFNHLVNFFSRYYEDGDFIPKRRYGARETYAVPYNGEEVFFHWANRDQHYVKTAERFKDYAFKLSDLSGEYRVRFTMTAASVPKDNTKGNRRYFFPRPDLAIYDANAREFVLPFEYRLPTPEEADHYGTNSKAQEVSWRRPYLVFWRPYQMSTCALCSSRISVLRKISPTISPNCRSCSSAYDTSANGTPATTSFTKIFVVSYSGNSSSTSRIRCYT